MVLEPTSVLGTCEHGNYRPACVPCADAEDAWADLKEGYNRLKEENARLKSEQTRLRAVIGDLETENLSLRTRLTSQPERPRLRDRVRGKRAG
jgi:regulator of replication initiation timing